ncbi:capsid cement protein [Erwinia papayae]|uniref:Capsid cement protein n=1 Tax=Erwinia papayae TaxID=206499 RepID=A0ABV3N395_9GAMM
MAKNFVQEGKTIPVINSGSVAINSGDAVLIGSVVAVAITDIAVQDTGDGLTEGVFQLPKVSTDSLAAGAPVYISDGTVQASATDAAYAGVAWESAATGSTVVNVKINAGAGISATTSGS